MRSEAQEEGLREAQVSRRVLIVAVIGAALSVIIAVWSLLTLRDPTGPRVSHYSEVNSPARPDQEELPRPARSSVRDGLDGPLAQPDGGWPEAPASLLKMVEVPAGTLQRGSQEGEGEDDETPADEVSVAAFHMDRYEVTNEDYALCVEDGACRAPMALDSSLFGAQRQPVVGVSWFDAATFCRWSGKRLPTEAEWERAARGDDRRSMPWGDEPPSCDRAVFIECDRYGPAEVGGRPAGASPCGAQDLAGNVWEWVQDWYAPRYFPTAPEGSIDGPPAGRQRVLRGGSWHFGPEYIRTSNRHRDEPGQRTPWYGFRCAYSPRTPQLPSVPGPAIRDAGPVHSGAPPGRRFSGSVDAAPLPEHFEDLEFRTEGAAESRAPSN